MEVYLFWAVVVQILLGFFYRYWDSLKPEPLDRLYYDITRINKEDLNRIIEELQSIIDESDDRTRSQRFREYINSKPNFKPTGKGRREHFD